jgi:hypothetical protein
MCQSISPLFDSRYRDIYLPAHKKHSTITDETLVLLEPTEHGPNLLQQHSSSRTHTQQRFWTC